MPSQASIRSNLAFSFAALLATAACTPAKVPPPTVSELMEDRVALDGALMKCNSDSPQNRNELECSNARIAVERLAKQNEAAEAARRQQEFERSREQLRLAQERKRQEMEAAHPKVDAYNLPLVPVEPEAASAASAAAAGGDAPAAVLGQTRN